MAHALTLDDPSTVETSMSGNHEAMLAWASEKQEFYPALHHLSPFAMCTTQYALWILVPYLH